MVGLDGGLDGLDPLDQVLLSQGVVDAEAAKPHVKVGRNLFEALVEREPEDVLGPQLNPGQPVADAAYSFGAVLGFVLFVRRLGRRVEVFPEEGELDPAAEFPR